MTLMMGLTACGGSRTDSSTADNNSAADSTDAAAEESQETDVPAADGDFSSYDSYKIRLANWFAEDHPQNIALQSFADEVKARSGGKMEIELYPNSQLGSEDVYINSILEGTLEMSCQGTMMAEYEPAVNVAEMPFLFTGGWEQARDTLGGEIGKEIAKDMPEKAGVRVLAWTANGFRVVSSSKPVKSVEDLKGLILRVPTTSLYVQTFEALGVTPVGITLSETYTALETGVADGQENPYATDRASSFYEVQDYIFETYHMFSPVEWCINEAFYQSLPEEFQEILVSAAEKAAEYEWELAISGEQEDKAFMQEQGVEITEVTEEMKNQMIQWLSSIPAPLGKFAVLGEQDLVSPERLDLVRQIFNASQVEVIDNSSRLICNRTTAGIRLVGISPQEDWQAALQCVQSDQYTVLVSHYTDPFASEALESAGIDYALGGNSHGTQITYPILGGYRSWPGSETVNRSETTRIGFPYYISTGTGCIKVNARLNATPEIVYILISA